MFTMFSTAYASCPSPCDNEGHTDCLTSTGHLTITVTTVASDAFKSCTSLTSVSMDSVEEIGAYAFYDTSLISVSMPEVLDIGERAFSGTSLTSVSMDSVEEIGDSAFQGTSLISVYIPSVVTQMTQISSPFDPHVIVIGTGDLNIGNLQFTLSAYQQFLKSEYSEYSCLG